MMLYQAFKKQRMNIVLFQLLMLPVYLYTALNRFEVSLVICFVLLFLNLNFLRDCIKKKLEQQTVLSVVTMCWLVSLFAETKNILDLVILITGAGVITAFSSSKISKSKVFEIIANDQLSRLIVLLVSSFAYIGLTGSSGLSIETVKEYPVISLCIIIILMIASSSIFDSVIKINEIEKQSDWSVKNFIKATKFILIPYIVTNNLKNFYSYYLFERQNELIVIALVLLMLAFLIQIYINKSKTYNINLLKFNTASLMIISLLNADSHVYALFIGLSANLVLYNIVQSYKNKTLEFLYFGLPFTPLFLYKFYKIDTILSVSSQASNIVLILFLVFPVLIYPLIKREGAYE